MWYLFRVVYYTVFFKKRCVSTSRVDDIVNDAIDPSSTAPGAKRLTNRRVGVERIRHFQLAYEKDQ